MQRYFINQSNIKENHVRIGEGDFHHIKHVMRLKKGDQLIVNTHEGQAYMCEIDSYMEDYVLLNIVKEIVNHKSSYYLDMGLALTKRDAFELALKKLTELDVHGIMPLNTHHSIIQIKDYDKKKERFRKICKESAEQSERSKLPYIYDLKDLKDMDVSTYDHLLCAYARHDTSNFYDVLGHISPKDKTLIVIGPEGGFSAKDLNILDDKGFKYISLGQTILRAETAAIYAASAYRFMVGR